MQHFRDSVTGNVYSFEDDVRAEHDGSEWKLYAPGSNEPLAGPYPLTLEPTDDPTPPPFVPSLEVLKAERDELLRIAGVNIAPLQDAIDLDMASPDDVALLTKWKQYRVAVSRVDLTTHPVVFPKAPA